MTDTRRSLAWAHGCLAVQALGAMAGPLTFVLRDGRQFNPLYIAPWTFEPLPEGLPAILRQLRGEWPCVPFGSDAVRTLPAGWSPQGTVVPGGDIPHGASSNEAWRWVEAPEGSLALALSYPTDHPVAGVTRRVIPDPAAPAVDFEFGIETRRDCLLPIGLHPTFRVPEAPGALRIDVGDAGPIRTYPGSIEPGHEIFAPDRTFERLEQAPSRGGIVLDASRVPFTETGEDLLQVVAAHGHVDLHYLEEGVRVRLQWDHGHFPSLLLWYSNRGRDYAPWSSRNLALGVEPICSAFDLGTQVSSGPNPIAAAGMPTARSFRAGDRFVTRYRIGVEADR